ncbi:hypothetical protein [Marinobacter sp. X15-166B]|uniref:hypothetical protein n=1 Tax=Marinobacter sp. X15-166B TaxID=1897620 RepID=UPI00085C45C9|nr:hypothetical protein [Marinobacter sp. X15-166B]OEY66830.1 hypothetical protein BG841_10430 [Marinobacter sp. X15-166B]
MAKPKKRRTKKHSNWARDQRLFSSSHLFTWEGLLSPADGYQYTTAQAFMRMGGWCPMGEDLARHLLNYPRNWMIGVRALCRTPGGAMWMESQTFDLPSHRLSDIDDAYHKLRADVLSAQRTDQVFDMGWIAQTWRGEKPRDDVELWHYYYAPPAIIAEVCSDERTIRSMAGPGYSVERYETWQQSNRDYLEERRKES